jgi:transcriptional regulator with XRE-family HTH domain
VEPKENGQVNERLRTTMMRAGVTLEALATAAAVDVKTVERWISMDRMPHRKHRWTAAKLLGVDEAYLWPDLLHKFPGRQLTSQSELVELYADRASVPRPLWLRLLSEAQENIDILVFSGTFYAQTQPRIAAMLTEAAQRGAVVRLCFGNPDSEAVTIRDREEGIGGTLAHKIRSSLSYYRTLLDVKNCEVRLHGTTLYTSLFRYDDEIMVNPHSYAEPASANPTFHFRRVDGGTLVNHYLTVFERVWETAMPWSGVTSGE